MSRPVPAASTVFWKKKLGGSDVAGATRRRRLDQGVQGRHSAVVGRRAPCPARASPASQRGGQIRARATGSSPADQVGDASVGACPPLHDHQRICSV
jgi:hypothetical protein